MQVIPLRHLNKLVQPPDDIQYKLIWARQLFPESTIYELSLERINGGYSAWFAKIVEGKFQWISNSHYLSSETLLLLAAEEQGTWVPEMEQYINAILQKQNKEEV